MANIRSFAKLLMAVSMFDGMLKDDSIIQKTFNYNATDLFYNFGYNKIYNTNPIYFPKWKKLKGYQKENRKKSK